MGTSSYQVTPREPGAGATGRIQGTRPLRTRVSPPRRAPPYSHRASGLDTRQDIVKVTGSSGTTAGYVSAQHLLTSARAYGVDLVGPVLLDTSRQAADDEGFDLTRITIDWERHTATCPQGKTSRPWTAARGDYRFF